MRSTPLPHHAPGCRPCILRLAPRPPASPLQGFPNHWQARVHYYWYKKQRDACRLEPPCDMGGFTRLLHSGEADDLMDEVPTVVVDHLPASILKDSSYVVLNRPYAFLMWLARTSIPERYILMAEADHLFLRPLPNLMNGEAAGAALFSYMVPANYPRCEPQQRKAATAALGMKRAWGGQAGRAHDRQRPVCVGSNREELEQENGTLLLSGRPPPPLGFACACA